MYSLYRAWLMRDAALSLGPAPVAAPLTTTAPSAPLGGAPNVVVQVGPALTHFSAHAAVLAAHSGYFKAALAADNGTAPISIPNINVDEFSSLLTFMYTGYLDLNLNNIYNILLATHVLHMPRALEICRDFLIRNHPLEPHPNIIKPIPSRKLPLQPQFYPPMITNLQSSETTPFKPINQEKNDTSDHPVASTSRKTPSPILNPCDDSSDVPKNKFEEAKIGQKPRKKSEGKSDDKVIIDIACCDGPVRFHRVINKCYGLTDVETDYKIVDSNEAMNKAMNLNIRDKKLSDENAQNESFTCVYCNHTFKSQYCYQKHARRHINPVTMDVKNTTAEPAKREVKLLDMNVQYYPCKTCGSKFPSYYFVHKHRKMCHSEEMERGGEKSPVNEERSNQ